MKPDRRGTALPIVLWALIALAALTLAAAATATLEWAMARNHADHAAALGLAEAGLAEALAAVAVDPERWRRADSLAGGLATGSFRARWEPSGPGLRVVAEGHRSSARRTLEARVWSDADGALRIADWREVR